MGHSEILEWRGCPVLRDPCQASELIIGIVYKWGLQEGFLFQEWRHQDEARRSRTPRPAGSSHNMLAIAAMTGWHGDSRLGMPKVCSPSELSGRVSTWDPISFPRRRVLTLRRKIGHQVSNNGNPYLVAPFSVTGINSLPKDNEKSHLHPQRLPSGMHFETLGSTLIKKPKKGKGLPSFVALFGLNIS